MPCNGEMHRLRVTDDRRIMVEGHNVQAELANGMLGGGLPDCMVYALALEFYTWDTGVGDESWLARSAVLRDVERTDWEKEWVNKDLEEITRCFEERVCWNVRLQVAT